MTWLQRFRPALFILGAVLVVGSLLGARALTAGTANAKNDAKTANPSSPTRASGPIVLGTVDSDPSPVKYGLPPVLQTGTVATVFVKDGQEIKLGDRLYEFDTTLLKADLERARRGVETAKTIVARAVEGAKAHKNKIELAKQAVLFAEEKKSLQGKTYKLIKSNLEDFWRKQQGSDKKSFTDEEINKRLEDDDKLLKAHSEYVFAFRDEQVKQKELAALEAADPQVYVKEAEAGVKQAEEEVTKAQKAIDLCTVKAKSSGRVERITISGGTTLGISTREPALWLIPDGTRVVRAEIEADFAHRVGKNIEGKEVTVFDNTDSTITYKGKVLRVGDTFLAKRSAGESILGNDTSVLEAVVEVANPSPPNQPPLRVGQRVRVSLGQ